MVHQERKKENKEREKKKKLHTRNMNTWLLPNNKGACSSAILHVNSFKYTIFLMLSLQSQRKKGAFNLCFKRKHKSLGPKKCFMTMLVLPPNTIIPSCWDHLQLAIINLKSFDSADYCSQTNQPTNQPTRGRQKLTRDKSIRKGRTGNVCAL